MNIARWLVLAAAVAAPAPAGGQDWQDEPQARIWLDRGDGPVLQRGDRVRVYYRTAEDAHVAIFHVDTDGVVRLLHPRGPGEDSFTRGGRDYRLLFPQWSYWYVDEYPGKGYFFLVASPWPLDLSGLEYTRQDRSWDLTRSGRSVYRDPYLAMDDYVALLIPDWETVPYALDFLEYDVGEVHEYPRFLCYDCHGFRSYVAWNPYTYACSSFRVVIWDDPYFYPTYRYGPTRVVYTAPRRAVARFEFKERAVGETWAPLVRSREAQPRRGVDYVEPSAAPRAQPAAAPPLRRPSGAAAPAPAPSRTARPAPGASPQARPPDSQERPVLQRRPSGAAGGGGAAPSRGEARPTAPERSATPSRPTGGSSASPPAGGSRVVRPPSSGGGSAQRPSSPPAATRSTPATRPPSASSPPARTRPPAASRPPAQTRPPAAASGSGSGSSRSAPPPRNTPPPRRPPGSGGGG